MNYFVLSNYNGIIQYRIIYLSVSHWTTIFELSFAVRCSVHLPIITNIVYMIVYLLSSLCQQLYEYMQSMKISDFIGSQQELPTSEPTRRDILRFFLLHQAQYREIGTICSNDFIANEVAAKVINYYSNADFLAKINTRFQIKS